MARLGHRFGTAAHPEVPRPPLPTIPALDGLRAIAVAAVVLFHSGHLVGGFLGVDLFFVLSGFLITTLLLDEHARTGMIHLGAFWARRARRLAPALIGMLLITLIAIAALFDLDSVNANRAEGIASVLYVSNWWTLHSPAPYLTVFQHTWSLSIEAQFYLLWPLALASVLRRQSDCRRAATIVLALSALLAVTSGAAMSLLYHGADSLSRVYFGTDTRSTPILFGCCLAAWAFRRPGNLDAGSQRVIDIGAIIALSALVALATLVERPDHTLYEGAYALVICPVLALLVAAAALTQGLLSKALSFRPLCALGRISYGVYLWHWPVIYLANSNRLHLSEWPLLAVQSAMTLAIAAASYSFIEQPIRRRRMPFTSRKAEV